jgi:hypothetical protein
LETAGGLIAVIFPGALDIDGGVDCSIGGGMKN